MKKILVLILTFAVIFGIFAGCSGNVPDTTGEDTVTLTDGGAGGDAAPAPVVGGSAGIKVGISMPTKDLRQWSNDGDQMEKELKAQGYAVTLDYASNDIATQVSQIDNMLNDGCSLLIIAAIDGDSLGIVLDIAKERNVAVISYDRLLMNSDAITNYVAFDLYMIGWKQGEYIRDNLKLDTTDGPYNIELFAGDPGDNTARYIFSGAMDVLMPYIDQGKVIVKSGQTDFKEVSTAAWASEAAQSRMDAIIAANYADGTTLYAVLCADDRCALGVTNALESNYNGQWPIITGCNCEIPNVKNILNGKQSMSVFCDTRTLASKAVEMADAILKGGEAPVNDRETYNNNVMVVPSFLCEPVVADKDNYRPILIDSGYYGEDDLS